MTPDWLDALNWGADGLLPAIVRESDSGDVLMCAWMNRTALEQTVKRGEAVFWSRSRGRLWHKGEESGHVQRVREVRTDCDNDVILLVVEQVGGISCHTGRHSCFFRRLDEGRWLDVEPVLKDPKEIYRHE